MTKTIKMSLVAAVAVAGLSSTVSAKPLEEAIKGVDVSGTMVYRYDERSDDKRTNGDKSKSENDYKIAATLKAPVNDMVTANVRVVTQDQAIGSTDSDFANLPVTSTVSTTNTSGTGSADTDPTLNVTNANIALNIVNTTAIAGKKRLTTPWTVAPSKYGNEQAGTGNLALSNVGPVTLAAAYFNQNNIPNSGDAKVAGLGTRDIYTVAAMGKISMVSLDAWYLSMKDEFTTYTIGAKATLGPVTAEARYANLDPDEKSLIFGSGAKDNSMYYIKLSGKVGPVGLKGAYAATDSDGGTTALDVDAVTTIEAWNVAMLGKIDADFYHLNANMDIMSGLNLAVNYADQESKTAVGASTKIKEDETYGQLTHKMGKNLTTYIRYGVYNRSTAGTKDIDQTRGRLQIAYKF